MLCKILPKDDNPAEYVNGASNAPSRNLVTAIKLAGYVVHSGTGGKVSPVDGDGREVKSNTVVDNTEIQHTIQHKRHMIVID